ncbi:small nuclear ribonucleoprotein G [Salpingoeca rosetta]|uniref:Small nuclear ribonucleoprotein G n=1 Tax=Salpingoeca rosetta (strain ATCC 50818 / BSB-021) TaxID=946362 RepID=F2U7Z6_SALR5|nr:small nuclear ribonucleoprotein G [Salpingoeca rosetta]EGD72901.1 small nuclear ribonucleoprotein G [Salpingoeca rosetta]|eukprot:XP_004994723.1 small nuclear ribonucleoprotein G [Salpingoeca rosetta]
MGRPQAPELKRFLDKKLELKLNANRKVSGILRGFDPFMNIVMDQTVEHKPDGEQVKIGVVVIRGNSIATMKGLEAI